MSAKREKNIFPLILLGLSFLSIIWTLSPKNGLVFDDYSLLAAVRFSDYDELFSMLPAKSYNDRSFRMLFLKLLMQLFEDNYLAYHIIFVCFHLANVLLVYFIVRKMLQQAETEEWTEACAMVAAGVFGIFPTSLMAVQWISSTCDFQCCTFLLLSVWWYLKARDGQYSVFYGLCCFGSYWLSLRCKEMSLALPVIFLVYEFGISIKKKSRINISWYNILPFVFMIFYAILLFTGGQGDTAPDDPYFMEFNPVIMLKNAMRYVALYFDPFNGTMSFDGYKSTSIISFILFFSLVLFALFVLVRYCKPYLLLGLLSIAGSIVVVLPMKNMQHRLYLYIPSVFIGIFVALCFLQLMQMFPKAGLIKALVILLICYLSNYADGVTNFQNYWIAMCEADKNCMTQIARIDEIPSYTHVYVTGAGKGYNIFYYGPGNSLRLHFDDNTIETFLVEEFPDEPEKPYLFLQYDEGIIREVARDDMPVAQVRIDEIGPDRIDLTNTSETGFNIWLTGQYEWEDLEVRLNGQPVQYVRGDGFISFTIPEAMREPGVIQVTLYSESACGESSPIYVKLY